MRDRDAYNPNLSWLVDDAVPKTAHPAPPDLSTQRLPREWQLHDPLKRIPCFITELVIQR
jgi:hypothetical protein